MPSLSSELFSARTVSWTGLNRRLLLQCTARLRLDSEYLCAGDSILDGRLYMFSSEGYIRDKDVGAEGNQFDPEKH